MSEIAPEQPEQSRRKRFDRKRVWKGLRYALLAAIIIPPTQVLILRFINPPFSAMMIFKSVEHLFTGEGVLWTHTNLSSDEAPRHIYRALVSAEDQRFYTHAGFDWIEFEKAQLEHERRPNKPMRG